MKSENRPTRNSELVLRDVLEASPMGIAILERATGRRMFVNSALAKIFGAASRETMLNQDISETWVNPDDLKRAIELRLAGDPLTKGQIDAIVAALSTAATDVERA